MARIEVAFMLLLVPTALTLVGYPLARRLDLAGPGTRGCISILAGLAALLLSISVINSVLPLAGVWAWGCVVPWLWPFRHRQVRVDFFHDVRRVTSASTSWILFAVACLFLLILLWPLFSRPDVIFYDGSANHDAFFWISNAEHLTRASYLVAPVVDPTHPFFYSTNAIIGTRPAWGRMGAEGLLALLSSVVGLSPLRLYVPASAAMYFAWLAAQLLLWRTFCSDRLPRIAVWGLAVLQPVFVFFHANANAPNLVGVLMGALVLVALARANRGENRRAWLVLLALGVHGVLVSYPEMVPVVAVAGAFLLLRDACAGGVRTTAAPMIAVATGLALNPLTTLRAWNGFFVSLAVVRPDDLHANMFASVPALADLPAAATLSVPLGHAMHQPFVAGIAALAIVVALATAFARARDRWGVVALLAGVALMVGFTLLTDFGYGWQKSVQFSGVATSILLPWAGLTGLGSRPRDWSLGHSAQTAIAAVAVAVFAGATFANLHEAHKWSTRKYLTPDWYKAREYSRTALRNVPVLLDARDFPWPYFYTMWSTYFLAENPLVFAGDASGGYVRGDAERHRSAAEPRPRAKLVATSSPTITSQNIRWRAGELALVDIPFRIASTPIDPSPGRASPSPQAVNVER